MNDINAKVLERLIQQAQIHLPMVEVNKEGLLNASQIMKAKPDFNYEDDLIEITEGAFSMTIGARQIFDVLFRWESMMNVKHYRFEVGEHREYRTFWCSSTGRDGKPEMKKLELIHAQGNLWYRIEKKHRMYIQIHELVAVYATELYTFDRDDIPAYLTKAAEDFKSFLLREDTIIPSHIVSAYVRIKDYDMVGKLIPVMQKQADIIARREKEREERRRKEEEEAAERARIEAEQKEIERRKEDERLAGEKERFINGEKVSGIDFVTLCKMHGIELHPKTVHNLQECVIGIDKDGCCNFKFRKVWKGGKYVTARPNLDGCFEASEKLYGCLA